MADATDEVEQVDFRKEINLPWRTEGKNRRSDMPLQFLEVARGKALDQLRKAEGDLSFVRSQEQRALDLVASARRNLDDVERAIVAVKDLPLIPLSEYKKGVRR